MAAGVKVFPHGLSALALLFVFRAEPVRIGGHMLQVLTEFKRPTQRGADREVVGEG